MNFSVRYEYQIKVVDLILTLIFTAHFIVPLPPRRPSSSSS